MIIEEEAHIAHFGILRRSGRYPWGSGNTIPQRSRSFLDWLKDMRSKGMSDAEIAKGVGMSTTELRAQNTIARNQKKLSDIAMAQALHDKGYANGAIAKRMNLAGESSVRALLAPGARDKADALTSTSNMLKRLVEEDNEAGLLDVGVGVENYVGVSKERLNTAVAMLKAEGYVTHVIPVPQPGTGKNTEVKVLARPGTTWGDVKRNEAKIKAIQEFSEDGGRTYNRVQPPLPVSRRRVKINYAEDGGDVADGVIYIRPGVKDLEIGNSLYAQVRIQVGDKHYLKGMAVYKDDLPPGVDLVFNTNKNRGDKKVLKDLEPDPELPFGSIVRQITDKNGKVTSAMNIVGTKETSGIEGSWDEWSKTLSSQMLSKQSPTLVKDQLNLTYDRRKKEFDEIMALTNPTVKKKLLEEFAESTDSAAVHLKAAHMPRQATRVLLPVNTLKDTEVYAPGFRHGETVALIRYPHGGTFEIPELTVNNNHAPAKKLIEDSRDAIGINAKVAKHLSGADFDGDTVIVIPNNQRKIKVSSPLDGLKNFDPQMYKLPDDSPIPRMTVHQKGVEMGKVSNLITDMTIRAAPHSDIVRAVRHSMVVIDAEKHGLNHRLSAERENIKQLSAQYQTPYRENRRPGASTLISRAGSTERLPELKARPMKEGGPIDKATGRKIMVPTDATTINRKGERVPKTRDYEKLAITDDAHTLSSGTRVEKVYADHSNRLKSLANEARLASLNTPRLKYSPSANKQYSTEVKSLESKLALAKMNAPRERQALIIASARLKAKKASNPNLEPETIKKLRFKELDEARIRTGASKQRVKLTEKEWEAIQAGAISDHKLSQILDNADTDTVRTLATPRTQRLMTSSKITKARSLLASGFTRAEVADRLGVSLTTLDTSMDL